MSEPTAPVCPQCGTPRATDGTPACSCGRLASEAHRDIRAAQAEAAEDFDPVRIRPFVKVGDEAEPAGPSETSEDEPQSGVWEDGDAPTASLEVEPRHAPLTLLGEQPPIDSAQVGRRPHRAVLAVGAGVAAAAVLVTGGIIGGLFSYEAPSRDGSGPGDIRADLPEAAAGVKTSQSTATPSRTASTASPPGTAATSPTATPTESPATPTPTDSGTPTRAPSSNDAIVTEVPAPTRSAGQPPDLGIGDRGAEVTELQLRLSEIGFYDGDADGDYDDDVESAVHDYQLNRDLMSEDEPGVYGEATRASLESETSEP